MTNDTNIYFLSCQGKILVENGITLNGEHENYSRICSESYLVTNLTIKQFKIGG